MDKRDLRNANLELLRRCLKQVRQATKPQLAELTELSVVTANSLLQELLLNKEAVAAEEAASSGGRRAQSYSFNAAHRLALAVYMHEKAGRDTMFISVEDLLGNTVEIAEKQPKQVNLDFFSEVLCPYFRLYPQISVVIVGLPGVEVQERLAVIDYPALKDTMFCTQLSARLGCPVIFENDVNAAVAGYAYSLGKKCQQETVVGIYFPRNYPPGAGIFLQGKLYKGRDGMAGEISPLVPATTLPTGIGADENHLATSQAIQVAAQLILLFASTWNPHRVVVYNELLHPDQAADIRKLCMQAISHELLPEIVLKSGIHEDYGRGIRCLAAEYLNEKKKKEVLMGKWLDLHMHSVYSTDGDITPEVLMKKCAKAGLKAVAVADHNTIRGVAAAKKAAEELGLTYFPAIEIDCMYEGKNFHLLGYGIHTDAAVFSEMEQHVQEQELAASNKLIELVRKMGFYFDEKLVRDKAKNGVVSAETMAEAVLNDVRNADNELLLPLRPGGIRSDNPFANFFWDFCAQGKPAYVPMDYVSLAIGVYSIKRNGGVAVLAHPGATMGKNREMTESMIKTGIDGIEVYSNYHDEKTKQFYEAICAEYGLIATSGSDFHGKTKPAIHLGNLVHPEAYKAYEQLVQKIKERSGEVLGCVPRE